MTMREREKHCEKWAHKNVNAIKLNKVHEDSKFNSTTKIAAAKDYEKHEKFL